MLQDFERRLGDNALGNHMLLHESQKQNKLHTLAIGSEMICRTTTYHVMLVGSVSLRHFLRRLLLATREMPKHAPMCHIVRIDGLHISIDTCEQGGQQPITTGSPKTFHQALDTPNHEDIGQELLRHLFWLAAGQGLRKVREPTFLHQVCLM